MCLRRALYWVRIFSFFFFLFCAIDENSFAFRLKNTQDQLCDVTKEMVKFKKDSRNKELNWTIERNKLLQNLELCHQRLGESYPSVKGFAVSGSGLKPKSSPQLWAEINSLKVR
jgi:hypothetical protein